jgi:DNA-binding CsgD family transcriptional regulator
MRDQISAEDRRKIDAKLDQLGAAVRGLPPADIKPASKSRFAGRKPDPAVTARRASMLAMIREGKSKPEIVAALGIAAGLFTTDLARLRVNNPDLKVSRASNRGRDPGPRRKTIEAMIREGLSRREIFDARAEGEVTITKDIGAVLAANPDLSLARSPVDPDRVTRTNGRRYTRTTPATGRAGTILPADHPAMLEERTLFPGMIKTPAAAGRVLKSGAHNRKIGASVLVGRLKGAPILTLTLPERSTCPACQNRADCYLNNMPMSQRIAPGDDLEAALLSEVFELAEANPTGFLIRIHIGGDFYSWDYLKCWARMLRDFPPLNVFGFTAWPAETPIGGDIAALRSRFSPRFEMRHSDSHGPHGSFQIDFPTQMRKIAGGIVCPEMRDSYVAPEKRTHCGSCGLCWTGADFPIVFITH